MSSTAPAPFLSRGERARQFGVDCVDSLDWKAGRWEPGGEYVKKLIVKNVSVNTIKVKYELPNTKFFSMEFPQLLTLSPGTFVALDVLFRPIRLEPYDDAIVFRTEAGKFAVRVCSRISSLKVTTPATIDFGFCPVGETTTKSMVVRNTGQKTATFALENGPPFELSPLEGKIEPGQSTTVKVSFSPTDATVFVASVVAYVPGLAPLITKISGIGKYPYVSASDTRLDYGTVVFGQKHIEEKEFELRNQSFVDATFEIVANETDRPASFTFFPSRGRIPPESHVMIRVRYAPLAPRTFSCDTFTVVTPGGNDVRLTCIGRGDGPAVSLSRKEAPRRGNKDGLPRLSRPSSLQFGDIRIGGVTSRVVYLTNHSEIPVPFQFVVEDKGTFLFNRTAGVIPPKLETNVTIFFEPKVSGNFYRRIFCLFKDQLPLCIDCIGTGYADLSRRPPPLSLAQVDAHRRRQRAGKGALSPAELEELLASSPEWFNLRQVDVSPCGGSETRLSRSGEATELELGIVSQFFEPQCGAGREVEMEQEYLDFGGCSRTRHPEPRPVRIYNHTNAKVTCLWRVPESDDDDDQADFMVLPPKADIPPQGSFVFKVAFLPTQNDFYYNQEVEAYMFFKSNRNFRLVNEQTLTPPWCLTIPVFGHTFGNASSQFLPRCRTSLKADNKVHFPPCYVGDSVYQTFQVTNDSDTPSTYKIEQDSTGVFTVKPTYGVISPGEFVLIACRFSPRDAGLSTGTVSLVMNNSASEATKFEMVGTGSKIDVKFENGGALYFKPTSTGIVTRRGFAFRNTSRVPFVYRWELPDSLEGAVKFEPSAGRVGGNERVEMACTFAPKRTGVYHSKATLWLRPLGGEKSLAMATKRHLNIVAEGRQGAVSFEPEHLDMGTTLVGAEVTKSLVLSNTSDADLHFRLESILATDYDLLDADHDGSVSAAELRSYSKVRNQESRATGASSQGPTKLSQANVEGLQASSMLGFEPSLGLLPARSRLKVMVTYRPSHPTTNRFRIFCDVVVAGADNSGVWDQSSRAAALSPRTRAAVEKEANQIAPLTCDLVGRAAYPTLQVEDARSALLSPTALWDQFALRQLNFELSTPLTRAQIRLNTRTGVGDKEMDHLYQNFLWEFTPRPAGSPAEVVLLSFKNVSKLPLDFAFKMPNETDVEVEQWADAGEPTEDELRQNSIIDARLFEVEPKTARLAEGETVSVRLSYQYVSTEFGGDHCIPVLFKLSKGKQVRIWLRGRTLPPSQARLYAPCTDGVKLAPIQIGHPAPPTQAFRLQNPSDCDVEYQVDMAAFGTVQAENYGFPIFTCPELEEGSTVLTGYLERGASASIPLVFQPLEDKLYTVELPVTYRGAHGEPCATGEALGAGVKEPVSSAEARLGLTIKAQGFHPAPAASADPDAERGLPSVSKETPLSLDSDAHLERVRAAARRAHDRGDAAMVAGKQAEAIRSQHGEDAPEFAPPAQQALRWEGMLSRLSVDRLAFGQVPAGSLTNMVTTIHNTASAGTSLEFLWDRDHPALANGTLKVYPREGRIPPGGSTVCKWTMQTSTDDIPKVLNLDVRCFVTGVVEAPKKRGRRQKAGSRRGTASRARSTRASSPTGSVLSRTSVVDRTTIASRGGLMESLASIGTGSRRPETGSTATGFGRSDSRLTRGTRREGPPPAAASCILFVNVTGEIVNPKVFRQLNQERGSLDRFFTPRLPPKAGEGGVAPKPPRRVISGATEDMRALAGKIMSELIDDLIADPSIEHLVDGVAPPAPPYFCQLNGSTTPRLNGGGVGGNVEGQTVAERKQTLQDVESQELIARIMENTVFNLVQDIAAGDFDLAETPRRFVKLEEAKDDVDGKEETA